MAGRSPGPSTNLSFSTIKGNRVILPKIDSKKFDKQEFIRQLRPSASISSLESNNSRERFKEGGKLYNKGLTEKLNIGMHGAQLFYQVEKADKYVCNRKKGLKEIKYSFSKQSRLKEDPVTREVRKVPGPGRYD